MDILDSAQKKDNQDSSSDVPDLSSLMDPSSPPPSDAPSDTHDVTTTAPQDSPVSPVIPDTTLTPEPIATEHPQQAEEAQITDTILSSSVPPPPPAAADAIMSPPPQPPKKKLRHKTALIVALLFFLISLPLIGYYVQSQQSIADLRNEAAGGGGDICNSVYPCGVGYYCGTTGRCVLAQPENCNGTCKTATQSCPAGFTSGSDPECVKAGMVACCSNASLNSPTPLAENCPAEPDAYCANVSSCASYGINSVSLGRCSRDGVTNGLCCTHNKCTPIEGFCMGSIDGGQYCAPPQYTVPKESCGGTKQYCTCGNPEPTNTPVPPTAVPTNPPDNTPVPTTRPTNTPRPTSTPTPRPTITPRPTSTPTPRPTITPRPTNTPVPTNPPDNTPVPTTPPTNTPVVGQCLNIKIYKDGEVVTDLNILQPGIDVVELAVACSNCTQARFSVNGGTFMYTSTRNNAGEYIVTYPLPSGVTSYTIEAQVLVGTEWK